MGLFSIFSVVLWLANIVFLGVAYLLYRPKRSDKQKPVENEFKLSAIKIGSPIPVVFGKGKLGGLIIEWGDWTVVAHEESYGKK